MIRDITIGRYYDSESVIHRMDPRTKLMGVLVYIYFAVPCEKCLLVYRMSDSNACPL